MQSSPVLHLSRSGTSVVLDTTTNGLPAVLYWGEALGEIADDQLVALAAALRPQRVSGGIDIPARLTIVPQESFGWQGTAGFTGHRGGAFISAAFTTTELVASDSDLKLTAVDAVAGLILEAELTVTETGLFRQRLAVVNNADIAYEVRSLLATFPLPASAQEVLDTTGRHLRERSPQRHALTAGSYRRESRKGRPGADASLLLGAGEPAFGFTRGLVHAVHTAWSGNHQLIVEKTPTGEAFLGAGELLLPGEIVLAPGQRYEAPEALGSWGHGLNELAARFHQELRLRSSHPRRPRPVTLNTWEAVYFDHNLERLTHLADKAAAVGIERFVLDDGWFSGRRDDTAGLGDWVVDPAVWPDGLTPLIDHVRSRGMEFGLWFEPEMVNPDSDLARSHPDWIIQAEGRLPVPGRQQQVLNLANPEAYDYILKSIDAVLTDNDISYIKWDHNREVLDGADARTGHAVIHENVLALYRLLGELKQRHPGLEIESCASGGARVDLGILSRTDRIWTSDCIDPIERLPNQKYTGLLVPPELMGMHVGGPVSHSTGRAHGLSFRAATAVFGHFGVEWDISDLSAEDTTALAEWIEVHKAWREVLHTGHTVHADLPDPAMDLRGVVARDGSAALFGYTLTASSASYPPGRITFPGLDPEGSYSISLAEPHRELPGNGQSALAWVQAAAEGSPLTLSGRLLGSVGLEAPVLFPEQSVLIELRRTDS
ncbi:alpha-galactosidase [Arthrobacter sp. TMN-37]